MNNYIRLTVLTIQKIGVGVSEWFKGRLNNTPFKGWGEKEVVRKSRHEVIILWQLITRGVFTQKHSVVTCRVHRTKCIERKKKRDRQIDRLCRNMYMHTKNKKLGVTCEFFKTNHRHTKPRGKKRMQCREKRLWKLFA